MMMWAAVYVALGAITFVVNLYVHYLRVSGYLGTVVRDRYLRNVSHIGGAWPIIRRITLASFLFPPLPLACCVVSYRKDWAVYRAEAESQIRNAPR